MKTISQYKADIAALMKKAVDIDAQATAENRDLKSDEVLLKNEILDTVEELNGIVATLERQASISEKLEKPEPTKTVQSRIPANTVAVKDKEKFGSLGEFLVATIRAGAPGGQVDPRLRNATTGMSEAVPSDGGFLVQSDFASDLLQQVIQTGILAQRCRRYSISGNANSIKINGVDESSRASSRFGGVIGYWKAEAAQKTASKPKFREIELKLKKLIGLCYATDELLSDASALEGFIRQAFPAEFGFLLDDAIINGTGAGQPLGILKSG
jgi:HK97 family phage major capsid protein